MDPTLQMIITIVCAVLASSGFWAFIQRLGEKKDVRTKMLLGIAHDKLMYLGSQYTNRDPGYITIDEYENFYKYLYTPYEKLGGNGAVKHMKEKVDKLPLRDSPIK